MSLYVDLNKMSDTVKQKWEMIGHKLGLSSDTLRTIGQKHGSSMKRFFAMLSAWLNRKGVHKDVPSTYRSVTLRVLVRVLQSTEVGESRLATELIKMKGIIIIVI